MIVEAKIYPSAATDSIAQLDLRANVTARLIDLNLSRQSPAIEIQQGVGNVQDEVADIIAMPSLAELSDMVTEIPTEWLNDKAWDDYDSR